MAIKDPKTIKETDVTKRRGSNATTIYNQLRTDIITMALQPGSVLDEVGLSKRFKLSRSPVREAIMKLANDGLVTMMPNRSSVVSSIDFHGIKALFDALDLMQRVVTRLAAINRRDEHIVKIQQYQEDFVAAFREHDLHKMLSANHSYHMEIAEAANNKYFKILYTRVLDEGKRLLYLNFQFEADMSTVESSVLAHEHDEMTKAIENRDADLAEKLASEHTVLFKKRVLNFLQEPGSDAIKI